MTVNIQCVKCQGKYCTSMHIEQNKTEMLPDYCPIKARPDIVEHSIKRYQDTDVKAIYLPATITEEAYENVRGVCMPVRPRIKELIEFAKLFGVRRLGMAFCSGLQEEASKVSAFLENQKFEVSSVICKCGNVDKTMLGIPAEYKIEGADKFEAACNPIVQAELLNNAGTEINIIVGLCIGHDMIFSKHSKAPVTTLIVKDRLLGHNPVIGLYSAYHRGIIQSQDAKGR
jgi:uncharacterized metal-binding protein